MFFYNLTELDENYSVQGDELQFSLDGKPSEHDELLQLEENLNFVGYRYFENEDKTFYVIKKRK